MPIEMYANVYKCLCSSLNPPEYLCQHAVRLLLQRTQVRHDLLHGAQLHGLVAVSYTHLHTDYQTTANIYTHFKSEMMKKSSVDMEDVFRRKQEAKGVLAKAQSMRDKRSRKPELDMSLPWVGKF